MTPDDLRAALRWRYATKKFDPARKLDPATWDALRDALVLSASSFGSQPWRFVVVEDAAKRQALRTASWDQAQVVDADKLVVFASKLGVDAAWIDKLIRRTVEVRATPPEKLDGYRKMCVDWVEQLGGVVDDWAARQTYLALGSFLTACAVLNVDACPMEGISPAAYDELLGLKADGFRTVCVVAVGYRAADDRAAGQAKVRFEADDVVRTA